MRAFFVCDQKPKAQKRDSRMCFIPWRLLHREHDFGHIFIRDGGGTEIIIPILLGTIPQIGVPCGNGQVLAAYSVRAPVFDFDLVKGEFF